MSLLHSKSLWEWVLTSSLKVNPLWPVDTTATHAILHTHYEDQGFRGVIKSHKMS